MWFNRHCIKRKINIPNDLHALIQCNFKIHWLECTNELRRIDQWQTY